MLQQGLEPPAPHTPGAAGHRLFFLGMAGEPQAEEKRGGVGETGWSRERVTLRLDKLGSSLQPQNSMYPMASAATLTSSTLWWPAVQASKLDLNPDLDPCWLGAPPLLLLCGVPWVPGVKVEEGSAGLADRCG